MTVEELIKKLSLCDPKAVVYCITREEYQASGDDPSFYGMGRESTDFEIYDLTTKVHIDLR